MEEIKEKNKLKGFEIPEGWKVELVGEAFEICNNLRYPISEEERNKMHGPFPYYGPTKIQDWINEFRVEGKFTLIGEDGDHFLKWRELPMTLLVEGKFNVNNHAHLVKGVENLTEWFYYYFQDKELTKYLTRQGAGRYKLTKKSLIGIPILLPPLPEQRAIAKVLCTIDQAIQRTEALIAQKELRKKWLMQNLLTGKKRLKGFEGEWRGQTYEQILKVVKRNFEWNENELYKLISVRRRSGGIFFRDSLYGNQILVKTLRTANEGDFLFSKMQILHGASALVSKEFDGAKISGSYIAVVAKDQKTLNMEFFQWYSQTPFFYHQTYVSSYGVHIEKMTFDFNSFLQLEIKLPSIEEQTAIAQVLQIADQEIKLLKDKANKLKEQKKGMMQVLLTGKVRVNLINLK
jgi:type I restriction enzyme S subunit